MGRTARITKTKLIAVTVVVAVAGAVGWKFTRSDAKPVAEHSHTHTVLSEQSKPAAVQQDYITYQGQTGKTALELLKTQATVKTKASSFGEFVESINGQDGGGKKYWMFYVNGKMSDTGAGEYQTKNGETIEWKLQ